MQYKKKIGMAFLIAGILTSGICLSGASTSVVSAETMTEETAAANIYLVETATGTTTLAGWEETDGGRKYRYSDGTYAIGEQTIDGIFYTFDSKGIQKTGWQTIDGVRHYYTESGTAAAGEQKISDVWYLFDNTGAQKTGWRTVNGIRQYYDPETGEPQYGWIETGGYRYYTTEHGGKQLGEITVDGIRYQMDAVYGSQNLGFCTFSDKTVSYYADDGSPVSGWLTADGSKYYFNEKYVMQTGWKTISSKKYYFDSNGVMQTGLQTISSKKYYFDSNGVMQTGWQTISSKKYYFDSNGVMQTGWQTISSKKYYFDSNGVMQTGLQSISSSKYYFNSDGKMQTGWQTISGSKYYFDSNGVMQTGWQTISGSRYYFDSDGKMQIGLQTIGENLYYFDNNGIMQKNTSIWLDAGWHEEGMNYGVYGQQEYYLQSDGTAITMTAHLLNSVSLESHNSFVVYNRQTSTTSQWTYTISQSDIEILENFKQEHFTSDMTREEQLQTVWEWIHYNVSYAYAGDAWNSISDKSWVDAVFTYKKGQCAQYNGAMASMMAYLGYEVNMVQGWVGSEGNQHFWTEVTIDGKSYLIETGNHGKNGSWSYFLIDYTSYDGSLGYIQY